MMNTNRRRIVRGTQQGIDREIDRLTAKGWRVVTTQIIYWKNSTKSFIAELEKE